MRTAPIAAPACNWSDQPALRQSARSAPSIPYERQYEASPGGNATVRDPTTTPARCAPHGEPAPLIVRMTLPPGAGALAKETPESPTPRTSSRPSAGGAADSTRSGTAAGAGDGAGSGESGSTLSAISG